jgi:NTP pyrophosphatase (non-canonical NTP hydrolase)
MTLSDWARRAYKIACLKGWHDNTIDVSTHCANLHGEVSELWESFRKGRLNKPCDKAKAMKEHGLPVLTCAAEELADVVIRAVDIASDLGIDIEEAVRVKCLYNETREYRHGGNLA